jgi:hypothetical protein
MRQDEKSPIAELGYSSLLLKPSILFLFPIAILEVWCSQSTIVCPQPGQSPLQALICPSSPQVKTV